MLKLRLREAKKLVLSHTASESWHEKSVSLTLKQKHSSLAHLFRPGVYGNLSPSAAPFVDLPGSSGTPLSEGARAHSSHLLLCPADLRSPRSLWWATSQWGRLVSLIGKRVLELRGVGPSLARRTGLRSRASGAPSGSAKTPLIRTTRPPSEWTLRWNDLRCWASRSVCSCEFFPHSLPSLLLPAPIPHLNPSTTLPRTYLCSHHLPPQLGHCWTGEVQVHRINLLPRSSR